MKKDDKIWKTCIFEKESRKKHTQQKQQHEEKGETLQLKFELELKSTCKHPSRKKPTGKQN